MITLFSLLYHFESAVACSVSTLSDFGSLSFSSFHIINRRSDFQAVCSTNIANPFLTDRSLTPSEVVKQIHRSILDQEEGHCAGLIVGRECFGWKSRRGSETRSQARHNSGQCSRIVQ